MSLESVFFMHSYCMFIGFVGGGCAEKYAVPYSTVEVIESNGNVDDEVGAA